MTRRKTNRRSPKRRSQKKQYRIRNWREYNAALVQRGSLTVWVDAEAVGGWQNRHKSGRRGASCTYSDSAMVCALTLQVVYHLPLRASEGLLLSLFSLLELALPVPDFSTLSRRRKTLPVRLRQVQLSPGQGVHLVVDSTGFKVYGEGEWKVRQHGWSKRRTWRKLHLGINEATGEVLAAVGSGPERADKEVLEQLLVQVAAPVEQVSGDGGKSAAMAATMLPSATESLLNAGRGPLFHHGVMPVCMRGMHAGRHAMGTCCGFENCKGGAARMRSGAVSSGNRKAATTAEAWLKPG